MKRIFVIIFLVMSFVGISQHSPINTQYMYHGLLVNPAITGAREYLVATISHRNQWLGSEYSPSTTLLSMHTPLKNEKISIGIQIYNDKVFHSRQSGLGGYVAYRIKKDAHIFSFGMKFGVYQNKSNWGNINTIRDNDPSFDEQEKRIHPGVGLGGYYRNKDFYFGLAIPELLGRRGDLMLSEVNFNLISGYDLKVNEKFSIIPNVLARKIGFGRLQTDYTILFRFDKKLDLGAIYRSKTVVGISIDYMLKSNMQIGYTFDVGLNSLSPQGALGNHEISLAYEFKKIVKTTSTKFF